MKVQIDTDEWYPLYIIRKELNEMGSIYDIPDELIERAKKADEEFSEVQCLISQIVRKK